LVGEWFGGLVSGVWWLNGWMAGLVGGWGWGGWNGEWTRESIGGAHIQHPHSIQTAAVVVVSVKSGSARRVAARYQHQKY
jgi:hypothetical protein